MFTGIIQKLGAVTDIAQESGSLRLRVETGWSDLVLGESISVNGACLTVAEIREESVADFFVSPETLARTQLGSVELMGFVNLERSVSLSDRLSGHWVQGHVDGIARLTQMSKLGEADNYELLFELPEKLLPYCVEKGSITLNGISLTINSLFSTLISIVIVPHTWKHTSFSQIKPGDAVNVEVDILAKYVERLMEPYLKRGIGPGWSASL